MSKDEIDVEEGFGFHIGDEVLHKAGARGVVNGCGWMKHNADSDPVRMYTVSYLSRSGYMRSACAAESELEAAGK